MKNFKPCWPVIIAVALGVTLVSCENDRRVEQYEKERFMHQINIPAFEEVFERSQKVFDEQELAEIIYPEGLDLDQVETEETGFSK